MTRAPRLAFYAAGFALVSIELPLNVIIPQFYTDVVGVSVGAIAAILLVTRALDAINDPLIGALTDATRSRHGRRRPWIALGAAPLTLAMFALFAPPQLPRGAEALYLLVVLVLLDIVWTAVTVPYDALGIEMTVTYDERTRVMGTRDAASLVGALVFAALPPLVAWALGLPSTPDGHRRKLFVYAALCAPLVLATCLSLAWLGRERAPVAAAAASPPLPPLGARLRAMTHNRPFFVVLASYTLGGIATQLPVTLHLFFVRYVLRAEQADAYLPVFVASGVVALPLWLRLAQRTEKRVAYIAALLASAAAQALTFFVGAGQTRAFLAVTIASGASFGAILALPNAMQGDVVDLGASREGGRRDEGIYLGVWSVCRKVAGAGGAALGLFVLSRTGFAPNAAQPPEVVRALRLLYTVVPAGLSVAAALAFIRYRLDRAAHARVVGAVAPSRARAPGVDEPS